MFDITVKLNSGTQILKSAQAACKNLLHWVDSYLTQQSGNYIKYYYKLRLMIYTEHHRSNT